MTISIEINRSIKGATPADDRYRATIQIGETETCMPTCYGESDSLTDALSYIQQEYNRGDFSKFSLFHKKAVSR